MFLDSFHIQGFVVSPVSRHVWPFKLMFDQVPSELSAADAKRGKNVPR